MTKAERSALEHIQKTLVNALDDITEMLGHQQTDVPAGYTDDSEAKERFIAP
jgi:hypothetical protein|tara:strand:- start:986 stop:1141 length:156 start_codon:yes stop_codon:yes gene_type:complete